MPDPTVAELREMMVDSTFQSDAFTVARGEKTSWMLQDEDDKAAEKARKMQNRGQAVTPSPAPAPPDPAPLPVLEKLAGVLKHFIKDDVALGATTKIRFKEHFKGVLTQGALILEPACDATFDAAAAADCSYKELLRLGMHRGGDVRGIDSLGCWVRSVTMNACMPNGDMSDGFTCLVELLKRDPELTQGGVIEWNMMNCSIEINRVSIKDGLNTGGIRVAIGSIYSVPNGRKGLRRFEPSEANVRHALEYLARKHEYHPVLEWFEKLPTWNNIDLIDDVLPHIGGLIPENVGTLAEQEWSKKANLLAKAQFKKTMIGTVARTYSPGCQMDTMLVLKSAQGTKKSTLFRALTPAEKFSDVHIDVGDKDSMMYMLRNCWYEFAELSGIVKKDVQPVKNFISCRSDNFRQPYGHAVTDNPRWCVLVGTTNDDTPLKDQTGSRRFWVIVIDDNVKADIPWVEANKPQLWAQAKAIYLAGGATCTDCVAALDGDVRCDAHRWWLSKEEDKLRAEVNETYTEKEPLDDRLAQWLSNALTDKSVNKQGMHLAHKNTDVMSAHEVLEALGYPSEKCDDPVLQRRITGSMKRLGFVKKRTNAGAVWVPPGMVNRTLRLVEDPKDEEPLLETDDVKKTT